MDGQTDHVTYWLDRDDNIVKVGGAWDRFARENDGPDARADAVVGRPIWDFVSGDTARMWLESLLGYTRLHGKAVSRNYRCDSPEVRRFLSMNVSREDRHHLRVEHVVEAIEPRDRAVGIVAAPDPSRVESGRTGTFRDCGVHGRFDHVREPRAIRVGRFRIRLRR